MNTVCDRDSQEKPYFGWLYRAALVPLPPSAVLHEVWAGATLLGPPVTVTVSLEQSECAVHLLTFVTLSALVCSKAGRQHSTLPSPLLWLQVLRGMNRVVRSKWILALNPSGWSRTVINSPGGFRGPLCWAPQGSLPDPGNAWPPVRHFQVPSVLSIHYPTSSRLFQWNDITPPPRLSQ